jgi:serine/threonine-protein kinase HipA
MNPRADASGLKLNVSDSDNAQDLVLASDVAPLFRVKATHARLVIDEVVTAVRAWRRVARGVNLSRAAQDRMARAFRVADA